MTPPLSVVIVGAGPRGTGVLERIAANLAELLPDRPLHLHLVDPHPPGAGRVWRHEQSALLRMNSMAEDVTMFTDDSVRCVGPVRPGPSLAEWAELARAGALPGFTVAEDVRAELAELTGRSFPTRRLQSQYLAWVYHDTVRRLPAHVRVFTHQATATRVTGAAALRQRVWLAGVARPLLADVVLLAQGHLDVTPDPEHDELAGFARRHGLAYLPPAYSSDVDLSGFRPGSDVVLRGFGLAAVDLVVLLTEGRGGRFETVDGELRYLPSGREPVLHLGSRRGVPYHSKTGYRLTGPPPELPKFFGAAEVDALLARPGQLDFRRDVWPLLAKEIAWGHFHELFTGHPDRVRLPFPEFTARFAALDWYHPAMRELVAEAVPDPADRIDFEALDRPLAGLRFAADDAFQEHLRGLVRADVDRRADPAHSADLGAFFALLSLYGQLPRLAGSGKLAARSRVADLEGWWVGFFSFLASGPPPDRLAQLLALSRAGVVRFAGADLAVLPDEAAGVFLASSPSTPRVVRATGLIEARLPRLRVPASPDPVLRGLLDSGEATEEVLDRTAGLGSGLLQVSTVDDRLLDAAGRPHPRRFAVGPFVSSRGAAAFARPRTNAPSFRQNDAVARTLLTFLADTSAVDEVRSA